MNDRRTGHWNLLVVAGCAWCIGIGGGCVTGLQDHTATLLPNGKVLVAGGKGARETALLYDTATGTFTRTGSSAEVRVWHTATLLPNGKVLIAGGRRGKNEGVGECLASAELYDPLAGTFTPTGSMTERRAFHTATPLPNGKVLVTGGWQEGGFWGNKYVASAELYDPAAGTFAATGSMTQRRSAHTATLLPNGKVLIAGGIIDNGEGLTFTRLAELYDPATETFTRSGSLTEEKGSHTATLLPNGKVLIAGGVVYRDDSSIRIARLAELYDPATETFTAGPVVGASAGHTATLLPDGKVLFAAGWNGFRAPSSNRANLYDPATGTSTPTGSLSQGREYHTATLLPSGKVLVVGGQFDVMRVANAELYEPATGAFTPTGSLPEGKSR